MKTIYMCADIADDKGYGGIKGVITSYINNNHDFEEHGFHAELISTHGNGAKKINKIGTIKQRYSLITERSSAGDVIHLHTSRKFNLYVDLIVSYFLKKLRMNKIVMTVHFCDLEKILFNIWPLNIIGVRLLRKIDALIVLSKAMKDELLSIGVPSEHVHVLYTFPRVTYLKTRRSESTECTTHVKFLFAGSVDLRKGILDLFDALDGLMDIYNMYELNIIGPIVEEPVRKEMAIKLNKKDLPINYLGYVSDDVKGAVFSEADVLVLPSYAEGLPASIMEALETGCAIISTRVGGIPEIITNNNGILVLPGDVCALSAAMRKLIEDRNLLRRIQDENLLYSKCFSLPNHIGRLCDVYKQL